MSNAFLQYNTGAAATTFFVNAPGNENEQTHSQNKECFMCLVQLTKSRVLQHQVIYSPRTWPKTTKIFPITIIL